MGTNVLFFKDNHAPLPTIPRPDKKKIIDKEYFRKFMAKCRMFRIDVILSSSFTDLSPRAVKLYTFLCMSADDEGFVGNTRGTIKMSDTNITALRELERAGYVYYFDKEGVSVIRHWKIHNNIRKDRMAETLYVKLKNLLTLDSQNVYVFKDKVEKIDENQGVSPTTDDKKMTEFCQENDSVLTKNCQENDSVFLSQVRVGKDRLDKVRVGKDSTAPNVATTQELEKLFPPPFELNATPVYPLSTYEKAFQEMERSSFARSAIKSLTFLHKHMDALLSGAWKDYKKKAPNDGLFTQNYTQEDMENFFVNNRIDDWDP